MALAIETGQSFREICEWWTPEDIVSAMIYLDDRADRIKDANNAST
jgi:hypothetical protein